MINVTIIGLGDIGLLYDTNLESNSALSHAKAIYLNKEFNLKYAIDIDTSKSELIKVLFPEVIFMTDYKQLYLKDDIDLLVISTPTPMHFEILNFFSTKNDIKLFFVEKPLFEKQSDYDKMENKFKNKLIINYIRNFEPNIKKLKIDLENLVYKELDKIIIHYTKGIKHSGSHAINLINFLFSSPKIIKTKILSRREGFSEDDLTLDIYLEVLYLNKMIPIYFIGLNHNNYAVFNLEFFFKNKKIEIVDSAKELRVYDIQNDLDYPEYKVITSSPKIVDLELTNIMTFVYKDIYNVLHKKINFVSFEFEKDNQIFLNTILKEENEKACNKWWK